MSTQDGASWSMSPEDLAEFEVSRDRAYELLGEAAAELRSRGGAGGPPAGGLAAAALAEALMHISAAQDALDRIGG
ncbi:hypothetical protein [Pseudonocardia acidicola]|uniref:Uncharacterized protein n=1 Tax=Pseudonocardia acidicola TaxID=2724939 RepID=A0ABX1SIH5_9PSEU|nr:hypothetical protein [Pseudonocardia acidicola]NMH99973.1 hypothetical protein [Pseudonocardia acidicola]